MAKLQWDLEGQHFFETGVSHGVLFPKNPQYQPGDVNAYLKGVAWNGLTSVSQSPSGAEASAVYADNVKYLNLMSAEEFAATIEAYTYPDEFAACDGSASLAGGALKLSQQKRLPFAFSYQTKIGNDTNPDLGYKIHIVYGATAAPSERAYETVNDSPEAITFSWEISTVPVEIPGTDYKPVAHLEIDSTKCSVGALKEIEDALYGTATTEPTLLMPADIIRILGGESSKLDTPVLTNNTEQSKFTIDVEADSAAASFDIYNGANYVKNITKSGASTEVTYDSLGLSQGTYYIKVKAQGGSHQDSDFSNKIKVVISE